MKAKSLFSGALLIALVGIWLVLNWYYSGMIETQSTTIESQLALIESLKAAGDTNPRSSFQRHLTNTQKSCLAANLTPSLKEFPPVPDVVGAPNLVLAVVDGEEPEIYANDFNTELSSIGFKLAGLSGAIPDHDSDRGVIVGIVDPNNPSKAALKFENALLNCGLAVTTEKSNLFKDIKGLDFDIFIADAPDAGS